jgi:hypothetical protein
MTSPRPARRRGYFLPGVIALGFLVGLGALFGAGDLAHPAARIIYGSDIAQQIAEGLQAQQGSASLPTVSCPTREPVQTGLRFECRWSAEGGRPRPVYVTETDSRGEVRWSLTPPASGSNAGPPAGGP